MKFLSLFVFILLFVTIVNCKSKGAKSKVKSSIKKKTKYRNDYDDYDDNDDDDDYTGTLYYNSQMEFYGSECFEHSLFNSDTFNCGKILSDECKKIYDNPEAFVEKPSFYNESKSETFLKSYYSMLSYIGSSHITYCTHVKNNGDDYCPAMKLFFENFYDPFGIVAYFNNINSDLQKHYAGNLDAFKIPSPLEIPSEDDIEDNCESTQCTQDSINLLKKAIQVEKDLFEYEVEKGSAKTINDFQIYRESENLLKKLEDKTCTEKNGSLKAISSNPLFYFIFTFLFVFLYH